jgi:hypothetical protein
MKCRGWDLTQIYFKLCSTIPPNSNPSEKLKIATLLGIEARSTDLQGHDFISTSHKWMLILIINLLLKIIFKSTDLKISK